MGYNRSGTRRTARLKRRKRHEARLMQKAEAAKRELKAFNNREHSKRRAVAYRDF